MKIKKGEHKVGHVYYDITTSELLVSFPDMHREYGCKIVKYLDELSKNAVPPRADLKNFSAITVMVWVNEEKLSFYAVSAGIAGAYFREYVYDELIFSSGCMYMIYVLVEALKNYVT